jgi:hypothetical protein
MKGRPLFSTCIFHMSPNKATDLTRPRGPRRQRGRGVAKRQATRSSLVRATFLARNE